MYYLGIHKTSPVHLEKISLVVINWENSNHHDQKGDEVQFVPEMLAFMQEKFFLKKEDDNLIGHSR